MVLQFTRSSWLGEVPRAGSDMARQGERATSPVESNHTMPHHAETQFFFGIVFVVDDVGSSASGSGYCGDSGNEEGSRAGTRSPTTGAVYS